MTIAESALSAEEKYLKTRHDETVERIKNTTNLASAVLNQGDRARFRAMSMVVPGGAYEARANTGTVEDVVLFALSLAEDLGAWMRKARDLEDELSALKAERATVRAYFGVQGS
jgi:hypothetical protein